ncbi:hypothetical protein [Thermosulfidibacter takaii]|nr:hypothetical protein [Thermosulfidibacter takaii]
MVVVELIGNIARFFSQTEKIAIKRKITSNIFDEILRQEVVDFLRDADELVVASSLPYSSLTSLYYPYPSEKVKAVAPLELEKVVSNSKDCKIHVDFVDAPGGCLMLTGYLHQKTFEFVKRLEEYSPVALVVPRSVLLFNALLKSLDARVGIVVGMEIVDSVISCAVLDGQFAIFLGEFSLEGSCFAEFVNIVKKKIEAIGKAFSEISFYISADSDERQRSVLKEFNFDEVQMLSPFDKTGLLELGERAVSFLEGLDI